jgi:hypothetical protein
MTSQPNLIDSDEKRTSMEGGVEFYLRRVEHINGDYENFTPPVSWCTQTQTLVLFTFIRQINRPQNAPPPPSPPTPHPTPPHPARARIFSGVSLC